jgi:hypothetical protein
MTAIALTKLLEPFAEDETRENKFISWRCLTKSQLNAAAVSSIRTENRITETYGRELG